MIESRRLLPLHSLAASLGLRPADLRRAAENGEIPFVQVGDHGRLFDRDLVERVLLARAAGEPPNSGQRPVREEAPDATS